MPARLGELLVARKLASPEDIDRALELQKERGDKIGKILVDLGFVAMRDVLAALSDQLEIPLVAAGRRRRIARGVPRHLQHWASPRIVGRPAPRRRAWIESPSAWLPAWKSAR